MPGIVTRNFRYLNAASFTEIFQTNLESMYFWIGKVQDWTGGTPSTPVDTIKNTEYDIWRTMFAMKKIASVDIRNAIARYDWVSGKVYKMWDDQNTTLFDDPPDKNSFYIVTTTTEVFRIYKCLYNNEGAQSTVQPDTTNVNEAQTTADGYVWKFMYSINAGDTFKFVTNNYIPVRTLTSDDGSAQWNVQQAAANGAINVILVQNPGSQYKWSTGLIQSGSAGQYVLGTVANNVSSVYVGSSIYSDEEVSRIIGYDGSSNTVTIDPDFLSSKTGSNYVIGPTVNIIGNGYGARAYANVTPATIDYGSINRITVANTGLNYAWADITITANTSYGSAGTARAIMGPPGGHGKDAIAELGGYNVMAAISLEGGETGNTIATGNEFHQYGLIYNVLAANGDIHDLTTVDTTESVRLDAAGIETVLLSEYPEINDSVIHLDNGAKGVIVRYITHNVNQMTVHLANTIGDWSTTGNLIAPSGTWTGSTPASSNYSAPDVIRYSGDVLFIENRSGILRDPDQTEDIKFVIRF